MGYRLQHRLEAHHIRTLAELYAEEWWTNERDLADITRMVEQAQLLFVLVDEETDALAGFARILTDYVYKAFLFDLVVAPRHRRRGLGKYLMNAILDHPTVRQVRHLELYCLPDMFTFYRQWGFTEQLGTLRVMRAEVSRTRNGSVDGSR